MNKRHFIFIASLIKARIGFNYSTIQYDAGYNQAVTDLTNDLADYFGDQNDLFDRARFLTACGVEDR